MNTRADKIQEDKKHPIAIGLVENQLVQKQAGGESTFKFIDNRPGASAQRKLSELANNSPGVKQLKYFQEIATNDSQSKQVAQWQATANRFSAMQQPPVLKKENQTGLPDNLKSGIENLSGYSMDDVKVHYNSDKPAQPQADAFAQGTDIHVGVGQEKHLPHEAWHVVQQKQGRVKPILQRKGAVNINDDARLEKEADEMGAKAFHQELTHPSDANSTLQASKLQEKAMSSLPIQLKRYSALPTNPHLGGFDVNIGMEEITMAGKLTKKDDRSEVNVQGSVMTEEYSFPPGRQGLPVKSAAAGTPPDALRVHNLGAEPQKVGLGQLLTYHHADIAYREGLDYVIAMNVTGARGPFYEKMGFTDYNPNPEEGYRAMEDQKQLLDTHLRKDNLMEMTDKEALMRLIHAKDTLTLKMADSPMIIKAKTLLDRSETVWRNFWKEGD